MSETTRKQVRKKKTTKAEEIKRRWEWKKQRKQRRLGYINQSKANEKSMIRKSFSVYNGYRLLYTE